MARRNRVVVDPRKGTAGLIPDHSVDITKLKGGLAATSATGGITEESTDEQLASAKAVYDLFTVDPDETIE